MKNFKGKFNQAVNDYIEGWGFRIGSRIYLGGGGSKFKKFQFGTLILDDGEG